MTQTPSARRSPPHDPTPPDAARPGPTFTRRWWLVGLALLAVGTSGYLLGHSSPTSPAVGSPAAGTAGAPGQQGAAGASGSTAQNGSGAASVGTGSSGAVIAVQASAVKAGTLTTTRTATGTVTAAQQTVVSAQTSGTVSALPVLVGGLVNAGQTVVSLSSSDLTSAVQSAQNALDTARVSLTTQANQTSGSRGQLQAAASSAQITLQNAQTTLAAQERLYGIGAISQTDLNTARAAVQQAQSSLSSAQNSLDQNARAGSEGLASLNLAVEKAQITLTQAQQAAANAKVTAPFAGQVTAIAVTGGQYLNAGSAAFTLTSSARQVNFSVPPSQSTSVKLGQSLTYTVGQQKYSLKVTENAGAPVNGNVQVVARIVSSGTLPALGAAGSVSYPYTVATGLLVPSTALQLDGATTSVFTVVDGKAKQVDVTVQGQANSQAAVTGLVSGAVVIAQPPSGLLDGASVTTAANGAQAGSSATAKSGVSDTSAGTAAPAGGPPAGGPGGAP